MKKIAYCRVQFTLMFFSSHYIYQCIFIPSTQDCNCLIDIVLLIKELVVRTGEKNRAKNHSYYVHHNS